MKRGNFFSLAERQRTEFGGEEEPMGKNKRWRDPFGDSRCHFLDGTRTSV